MSDLKFSKEHTWVNLDGNTATVGISDFAQKELGDIVFIEFPEVGDEVTQGKSFGTIESVKAVSDLHSPISGKVIEVNELLEDEPEIVNANPQSDGWIIKVELSDSSQVDAMLSEADYATFTKDSNE